MISLRRPMLLLSLVALGMTVLVGIGGIVMTGHQRIESVIVSVVSTVVALGAVMGLSFLVDRKGLRVGTLALVGAIGIAWALIVALAWADRWLWGMSFYEKLALSLVVDAFVITPGAGMLLLSAVKVCRWACWVFTGFVAVAAVAFLAGIWFPMGWQTNNQVGATGGAFYGIGFAISACMMGFGRGDKLWYRWIGVVVGGVALGVACVAIWGMEFRSEASGRTVAALIIATAAMAHFVVTNLVRLSPGQEWLRWCTHGISWATSLVMLGICVLPDVLLREGEGMIFRVAGALLLVTAGATLTMLILWRLNMRRDFTVAAPLPADLQSLDITCPGCGLKQHVGAGKSSCRSCALRFEIKIEEPHCVVCGYLLYRIAAERCPECGTPVAQSAPTEGNAVPGSYPVPGAFPVQAVVGPASSPAGRG